MADPIQKGNLLVAKPAPTFADFVVNDNTWKEKDSTEMNETKDGNSETYNYTFANPGVDATAELTVKKKDPAVTLLIKGAVISSTETTPRHFVVVDVENGEYGGRVLKQTVSLAYRASLQSVLGS